MMIETKPQKPRDKKNLLFGRVEQAKKLLPKDWRKRLANEYPQYDSLEMADFLTRVHSLRAADEQLTVIFEKIVADYQAEKEDESTIRARMAKMIKRQKICVPE